MTGRVVYTKSGHIASVLFDRVAARNAMTWVMYDQLADACRSISADDEIRVVLFRGAGGNFAAGTDITQFAEFTGGDSGINYERRVESSIDLIERIPKPVIAAVEGNCVGGGLMIAAACDLRVSTPDARFGVPIARTLGNCLSPYNVKRLVAQFGSARTSRMLIFAELLSAAEALACGFVSRIAEPGELDEQLRGICHHVATFAPITMAAAKETIRRANLANVPDCDDLIRRVYGSADFHEGVTAFIAKRRPKWQGR